MPACPNEQRGRRRGCVAALRPDPSVLIIWPPVSPELQRPPVYGTRPSLTEKADSQAACEPFGLRIRMVRALLTLPDTVSVLLDGS